MNMIEEFISKVKRNKNKSTSYEVKIPEDADGLFFELLDDLAEQNDIEYDVEDQEDNSEGETTIYLYGYNV